MQQTWQFLNKFKVCKIIIQRKCFYELNGIDNECHNIILIFIRIKIMKFFNEIITYIISVRKRNWK